MTEHYHDFERDDGSVIVIKYRRSRYYPASGPSWNDPGCPAEGGTIEDLDCGPVTLTDAELDRAEAEIYATPVDDLLD